MVPQVPAPILPFEDGGIRDRDSASSELYSECRIHLGGIAVDALSAHVRDLELRHVAKDELHGLEGALDVLRLGVRPPVGAQTVVERLRVAAVDGIDE